MKYIDASPFLLAPKIDRTVCHMKFNNCDEHVTNDDDNNDSGNDNCREGDVADGVDCDGCRQKHIQSQL